MLCCGIVRASCVSAQFSVSRASLSRIIEAGIELTVKSTAVIPGKVRVSSMISRFSPAENHSTETPPSSLPVSLEAGPRAPPTHQTERQKQCTTKTFCKDRALWSRRTLSCSWSSIFHLILQTACLAQNASSDGTSFFPSSCRFFPQLVRKETLVFTAFSVNRSALYPLDRYTRSTADSPLYPCPKWEGPPPFPVGTARCSWASHRREKQPVKNIPRSVEYILARVAYQNNLSKGSRNVVKEEALSFLVLQPTANVFRRRTGEAPQSRGRSLVPRGPCVRTPHSSQAAATYQQCGEENAFQLAHSREEKKNALHSENSVLSMPNGVLDQFPFAYGADAFARRRTSRTSTGVRESFQDDRKKSLIYFDNAATTQKPWSVLQELQRAYIDENANVHRSTYSRAAAATERLERCPHMLHLRQTLMLQNVRSRLAKYLNAEHADEIVFTSGATDSINLVAGSWGEANVFEGDEIVLSVAEHHSNIVPWQLLATRKHASLRYVELDEQLLLSVPSLLSSLSPRTKLVALSHTSNVLGSFNPYVREVIGIIKQYNPSIVVLLDASQALAHLKHVHRNWSTYADPPARFEAGTPPFVQVAGLGAALDFMEQAGLPEIVAYELKLYTSLRSALEAYVPSLRLFCPPAFPSPPPQLAGTVCSKFSERVEPLPPVPVISFLHPSIHAQDMATFLDVCDEIYVRSGHHCCQLLHREVFRVPATCRASLAVYNTEEEVHRFAKSVQTVVSMLEEKGETSHTAPGIDHSLPSQLMSPQGGTLAVESGNSRDLVCPETAPLNPVEGPLKGKR